MTLPPPVLIATNLADIQLADIQLGYENITKEDSSGNTQIGILNNIPVYLEFPSPLMSVAQSANYRSAALSESIIGGDNTGNKSIYVVTEQNAEKLIEILKRSRVLVDSLSLPLEDAIIQNVMDMDLLLLLANTIVMIKYSMGKKKIMAESNLASVDQEG